ncbi:bifunctional glycosyltransferase/CDP-glycerol:glycerophosphate glycerophosphotransferase [Streptomyces pinistramenti]|uniref:bifunctional glycosyltransferase/CDP-glycerol:glycerophosphate glycerophosphotransferase n=1 Tax=Streptomyces pinistramenti TaxID=2884812 RepID=UPI001D061461|nr:bifunctional glycosyltransferase family 2 protein/CDP-glycerol:glycerophosphate glycerophosphotransferase [Streptomyces pinistramenti]MCB5911727.1 bifunctional glycosyltransferase family 2 protein/CDP-glycerol:glycerophosphate glycerophosphotransferase [Streptomyces pinistramenti]
MSEIGTEAVPRFSIIVPVYKVQGFLRECMDSVLEQEFTDFELIAVDDCSPDSSGAILDEYAARDKRVIPVHRAENGGIGQARNTGVEQARGDYLLFLDSDDTYAPGALQAMADRLAVTSDPEILLFDHVRTYWWNKVQPSASVEMLQEAGTEVFRPADRLEFLNMFAVVWNRAFRRDFFTGNGFQYTDGLYEDALMVYTTMLTAETAACLDQVCVEYRQRRQGNSMKTPGRKHFTIFEQYQRLFAFLDTRPDLNRIRPLMFERMVSHFLFTFARDNRVTPADRAEFFHRAAVMYRRHQPAGFVLPEGITGAKYQALGRGSYRAFQALKLVNGARVSGRDRLRRTKRTLGKQAFQRFYQIQLHRPVDENLAVYSAYWNRTPACNPLAIYEKAKELAPHVHGVWVIKKGQEDTVPAGVDHVVANSPRYWEVMARAKYLINNVNFAGEVIKRPEQVHLQTHHGTPLKRMGIDQQKYPAAAKGMSMRKLLERADRWDFSLSSNLHATEQWERVYPCTFQSLDAGYPRNDVFYRATAQDVREIRERLGIAPGRIAVLYAPTVRDYQTGYVPRMDLERVTRELGPDFVLLVRTHYFYAADSRLAELQERGALIDVSAHPVVEELCLAADALITDYSSIMFDYANLDRPIISYADDWDTYVRSRGVTFDLLSGNPGDTPGAVATDEDQLIDAFRSGRWDDADATELRAAFRARFCQWDDGHAAERVVRRIFLGQEAGPAPLPPAERTVAPSPRAAEAGLRPGAPDDDLPIARETAADVSPSDIELAG